MKKIHIGRNIQYLIATVSFLINLFAEAFVFEANKNTTVENPFMSFGLVFFNNSIFQFAMLMVAAIMMSLFYYRYFKRHRSMDKKIYSVLCMVLHIVRPFMLFLGDEGEKYIALSLFVVLLDAVFLTVYVAPGISNYFFIINIGIRVFVFISVFVAVTVISMVVLGLEISFIEIALIHMLMMITYGLIYMYYTILKRSGRR